jgi:hypothetical protein
MNKLSKSVAPARFNARTKLILVGLLSLATALSLNAIAQLDARVELTQHSEAQAIGQGGGLATCTVTGGILSGACTVSSPLTATISTDGSLTGTGSAGSPLSAATALSGLDFAIFGDGSDGACTFNGSTTPVAGATLSGSTYTLTRDVFCSGGTISSGVNVTGPYRIFDNGTFTLTGKIDRNGNAGSGSTQGAALAAGSLPGSVAGGAGGSSAGGAASAGGAVNPAPRECTSGTVAASGGTGGTCQGGSGGTGAGGAGAASGNVTLAAATTGDVRTFYQMPLGRQANAAVYVFSGGGGGGRGDAANVKTGGGGGGSGGYVYDAFKKVAGAGAIEAKGGNGGDGQSGGNTGSGAGGAGGYIVTVIGTGSCPTQTVTGGTHGAKQGTGTNGGDGGAGIAHCYKAGY